MRRLSKQRQFASVLVALLLSALCCAAVVGLAGANGGGVPQLDGAGTPDDPYVVTAAEDLQAISEDLDGYYVLGDDVDASVSDDWNAGAGLEPIGDGEDPFTGTFDGRNHTIRGLTARYPSSEGVGLFGVSEGTVRNLHVVDATVSGERLVAAIVGENYGEVVGVSATGEVTGNGQIIGGAVGLNREGGVSYSWADVTVSSGSAQVGGIVGRNTGQLTNSYALGAVSGPYGGSLAGSNAGSIQRTYAAGSFDSNDDDHNGGIAGRNSNLLVDSYWDVETTGWSTAVGEGESQAVGLTTAEMTGSAATDSMSALVSDDAWITTDGYPKLARNVEDLTAQFDGVVIAGNESELSASLSFVGDRTEGVVAVADYESSDTAVATVENGVVTGNQAGQATITVSHAGETATADVVVIDAEGISPTVAELDGGNVTTGEAVTVTGTLRNVDENATFRDVSLQVDDENVTTANVTVDGDAEATHTFEWTPEETGSYDLTVDGIDAGTLQVTDPAAEGSSGGSSGGSSSGDADGSNGSTDGGSGDLPVTLAVVGVLATAVVALLARRRR